MGYENKDVFKTVCFRLNISREDENSIYQVISNIEKNIYQKKMYGNKSKFIKGALLNYIDELNSNGKSDANTIQTEVLINNIVSRMRDEFIGIIKESEREITSSMQQLIKKISISGGTQNNNEPINGNNKITAQVNGGKEGVLPESGGELPDNAMDFINSL